MTDGSSHQFRRDAFASAPIASRHLLRDEVYVHLHNAIINGDLKPGQRVRDSDLAEELEVSRTPVREALRRLEDERFVFAEANRWTRVAPIDESEADRVYPIVWALESLALQLAEPSWTQAVYDEMKDANDELARAVAAGDALASSASDYRFHRAFIDAAGNDDLSRMLDDLKLRLRRMEVVYFGGAAAAAQSVDEHNAILRALEAGDFPAARRHVRRNWERSLRRVKKALPAEETVENPRRPSRR